MREIKFRAWNEKTKRFTKDSDNAYLSRNDDGIITEQYTCLKDKNDKEVYEGDIVRMYDSLYLIKWSGVAFSYIASGKKEYYWLSPGKSLEIDIIGNIHENPELLGGEQ